MAAGGGVPTVSIARGDAEDQIDNKQAELMASTDAALTLIYREADETRRWMAVALAAVGAGVIIATLCTNSLAGIADAVAKHGGDLRWWLAAKALSTVAGVTVGMLLVNAARLLSRPTHSLQRAAEQVDASKAKPSDKGIIEAAVDLMKAITAKLKK